jgi:LemA protein
MKNFLVVLAVLAGIGLAIFGWYKSGYNRVIGLDENVKSSWAQVENQLQRRFDLIPNLVNTVKGYAAHESNLLTDVTKLRSQWSSAPSVPEKVEAANQLTGALSRLIAVSENYPDLKANQNFVTLQSQLEGTENRIAVERMRYNQAVQAFNAYQRSFFGRFFAGQAGLTQPAVYFKIEENAKAVPQVNF